MIIFTPITMKIIDNTSKTTVVKIVQRTNPVPKNINKIPVE